MGVHAELAPLDEVASLLGGEFIVLNDLDSTEQSVATINALIYKTYSGDVTTILPSCECGALKGAMAAKKKKICNVCDRPVVDKSNQQMEALLWVRKPVGVEKLILPVVFLILQQRFKKSSFDVIKWLMLTNYDEGIKMPPSIQVVETMLAENGIPRGYNSFVRNFDIIIDILLSINALRKKSFDDVQLREFIKLNREDIFSDYIPIPNRTLLVMEKTNKTNYVDATTPMAVNAALMMVGIDTGKNKTAFKERRTATCIADLSKFYSSYVSTVMTGKPGVLRRHVYGTRMHWSMRSVITSITSDHHYREMHISWSSAIVILRLHLMNLFERDGYSLDHAATMLAVYAQEYNEQINNYFLEIVGKRDVVGEDGVLSDLPCVLQRNQKLIVYPI